METLPTTPHQIRIETIQEVRQVFDADLQCWCWVIDPDAVMNYNVDSSLEDMLISDRIDGNGWSVVYLKDELADVEALGYARMKKLFMHLNFVQVKTLDGSYCAMVTEPTKDELYANLINATYPMIDLETLSVHSLLEYVRQRYVRA